jgi:hypothetical protein
MVGRHLGVAGMVMTMVFVSVATAADEETSFLGVNDIFKNMDVHGFYEARGGYRLQNDPYEKDMSVMEGRFQLDLSSYNDWADFKYKGDVWGDWVTEEGHYDTRELWMFTRPTDFLDVKLGRQILTWGTGDLLFLNDLFPKDWQSFLIGRDTEYLKAPSDAAKFSFFNDIANVDFVYTPKFDPDRYITGEYLSYWNPNLGRLAGQDAIVHSDKPDDWFTDDEFATRVYKNINNYEYALYGYWGYWKSPGGQTSTGKATFPKLDVYGASVRGQVSKGIGNVEIAYYRSADDTGGDDPLVNNSEMRYLIGYEQEIGKDLNAGMQYYVEQMLDHDDYKDNLPASANARDEFRQVITLRLTKLLMNQNLKLSLFTFYSPSDEDAYLRPNIQYKATDNLLLETGANVFFGDEPYTFFSQFENNTSLYTAVRYSF